MSAEQPSKSANSGFLTFPVLRDLSGIFLIVVLGWKLISADIQISVPDFAFSELLALLLSLFSVWLSAAFYFKANETSNQFYDNSYKFTKEMAEILGRIEAGFGERLRHLDEGYSGIRDKFDRLPPYSFGLNDEVRREESEIKKREKEQRELLEMLADRAKLAKDEKRDIFAQLAEKNEELEQARLELNHLRNRGKDLSPAERGLRRSLIRYVADRVREHMPDGVDQRTAHPSVAQIFNKIKDELHDDAIRDLKLFGFTDEDGNLTRDSIMRIRMEMRRV